MNFQFSQLKTRLQTYNPFLLIVLISICISGCGGGSETPKFFSELVPAKGKITLDDAPLGAATVSFIPQEGETNTRMASAITDNSGVFELITPIANVSPDESKGIAPGQYKVVISKVLMPDGSVVPPETTEADAMAEGAKESLPAKFSGFENTKLTVEVKQSTDPNLTYDFNLKSK